MSRSAAKSYITIIVLAAIIITALAVILVRKPGSKTSSTASVSSKSSSATIILDPTAVVRQTALYQNKTISLRGRIAQAGPDYYIVGKVTSNGQPPGAVKLDFSKTKRNPKQYIAGNTTVNEPSRGVVKSSPQNAATVIVTGELQSSKATQLILVVGSASH